MIHYDLFSKLMRTVAVVEPVVEVGKVGQELTGRYYAFLIGSI